MSTCEIRTCRPNQIARLRITLTTAAVFGTMPLGNIRIASQPLDDEAPGQRRFVTVLTVQRGH
jgi:hypothetical protein